jgi:hypothetical protein
MFFIKENVVCGIQISVDSGGPVTEPEDRRGKRQDSSSNRASNGWWLRSTEQVRSQSQRRGQPKHVSLVKVFPA